MKVKVTISQRGYRHADVEIEVGDQPDVQDAADAAYVLAEQMSLRDPSLNWGPWQHTLRETPDPDDIAIIHPIEIP